MKFFALRIHVLLLLSALSLTALTGCGSQVQNTLKVQTDLNEAFRQAQIGQTAQARQWADRAIAVDPSTLSTYVITDATQEGGLTVSGIFAETGDETTLRDYMKQAAAKFPNDYRPLVLLDQAYGMLGDIPNQKATATTLAALLEKRIVTPGSVNDEEKTLALAQAYCDAGNLTKGAADYQAVINAKPNDTEAYNDLAYAYAVADSTPNLPQALALAQRALALAAKLAPTNLRPQEQIDLEISAYRDTLGWVQYRMGDYPNALANVQAAINVIPREAGERYHLGMIYKALHQPDAARAELTHATLLAQGYADAQRELNALNPPSPTMASTAKP